MANKKKKLKVLRNLLDKFLDYNAPYNFLLDSTFCAQAFKIQNLDGLLEEYMNGQVKLFTTTCAISESKSLGKEMYQKSKPIFEKCEIFQCGHKKNNTKAADCITEVLLKSKIKFILCTQDVELQHRTKKFENPVPIFLYTHGQIIPKKIDKTKISQENKQKAIFTSYSKLDSSKNKTSGHPRAGKSKSRAMYGLKSHRILDSIRRIEEKK